MKNMHFFMKDYKMGAALNMYLAFDLVAVTNQTFEIRM
jgi:hypothetical protein